MLQRKHSKLHTDDLMGSICYYQVTQASSLLGLYNRPLQSPADFIEHMTSHFQWVGGSLDTLLLGKLGGSRILRIDMIRRPIRKERQSLSGKGKTGGNVLVERN